MRVKKKSEIHEALKWSSWYNIIRLSKDKDVYKIHFEFLGHNTKLQIIPAISNIMMIMRQQ